MCNGMLCRRCRRRQKRHEIVVVEAFSSVFQGKLQATRMLGS